MRCRSLSRSCHPLLAKLYLETRLLRLLKKAAQLAQRELLNTSRESVDSRGEKGFSIFAIGSCDNFQ